MTTWAVWFVAAMIVFACIEGFALVTRRIPTLSATIWQLTKRGHSCRSLLVFRPPWAFRGGYWVWWRPLR